MTRLSALVKNNLLAGAVYIDGIIGKGQKYQIDHVDRVEKVGLFFPNLL